MKFQFNIKMKNDLTSHRFCFVHFQVHVISFLILKRWRALAMKFQFNIKMENDLTSVFFLESILKRWRA